MIFTIILFEFELYKLIPLLRLNMQLLSLIMFESDCHKRIPEFILKLSELMSYTLYECKEKFVQINKEIDFIKNYLESE